MDLQQVERILSIGMYSWLVALITIVAVVIWLMFSIASLVWLLHNHTEHINNLPLPEEVGEVGVVIEIFKLPLVALQYALGKRQDN